jgi:hypothetical protein
MSVSFPITAPPAPAEQAPRGLSLWELGAELQAETRWIAQLAERLDTGDEAEHALAVADLEECLAAEESRKEGLLKKTDPLRRSLFQQPRVDKLASIRAINDCYNC